MYIYIYIHTHVYMNIYIYIYICIWNETGFADLLRTAHCAALHPSPSTARARASTLLLCQKRSGFAEQNTNNNWALLLKGQKGRGQFVWAKSGHLAQCYYHMLSARSGMGEGERASTTAGSRA